METEVISLGADIVTTMTDAATGFALGFGNAVVNTFNAIVLNANGNLSNLGVWGLTFGGIAIIIGLSKHFTRKVG